MPTYNVDLTTDRGQFQRIPFTLDDDRPLGPQIQHVLEELRLRGLILRGGPEDELAISWNGKELDGSRLPQDLRISPHYSIELKMRRRQAIKSYEVRPEPPATPFLARGSYLGSVAGFTGGAFAWVLSATLLTDLPAFLPNQGALDVLVAALLGSLVGALVLGFEHRARVGSIAVGTLLGLLAGGLGAGIGVVLGGLSAGPLGMEASGTGFRLTRLVAWLLMGLFAGLAIGLAGIAGDRRRPLDGALAGAASGLVGGVVMLLPGPTDLWQMLAFCLVGTSLGYGLIGIGLRRGVGLIELEQVGPRHVGLFGYRWWPVRDNATTPVAERFAVQVKGGQCLVLPAGGTAPIVAGKSVTAPAQLVNQDRIGVAEAQFRFRRFLGAGL